MDNPGISLFKGDDIKVNNSQNHEEEEDLEDQIRRREELQNLLTNAMDEFKYEDSTINSSTNVSIASGVDLQNYCDASTPNDQLKILYDVRLRELASLRKEFDDYKLEKSKEIDNMKNKLILAEAEMRQIKVSLNSTESLLIDKTEIINCLKNDLAERDLEVQRQQKRIEQFEIEVTAYKTTINELHMKLQMDNNLFTNTERKFNSEETQRINKENILRLETRLEEEIKRSQTFEKEVKSLKDELNLVIAEKKEMEEEEKSRANALIKSFEDAQQQCRDLLDIIAVLTKENEHFRDKLNTDYTLVNQDTGNTQTEKLKRILVDKSLEISSLQAKVANYNESLAELLEYRQLKVDARKKENVSCNNRTHIKDLLILQNDLKNCQLTITDKENQIANLTTINKELQEKIEEMLLQTRNEIQNLSIKYNLPQLEMMSKDLNKAESRILELEQQLRNLDEEKSTSPLKQQIEKAQQQIIQLQKISDSEKNNLEGIIRMVQKDLEKAQHENEKLRQQNEELQRKSKSDTNISVLEERKSVKMEYSLLKEQLSKVMAHLQEKTKLNSNNFRIIEIVRNEIGDFLMQLKETDVEKHVIEEKLISWKKELEFTSETDSIIVEDKSEENKIIAELNEKLKINKQKLKTLECEIKIRDEKIEQIASLESELKSKERALKLAEDDKMELANLLQEMKEKLDESKNTILDLERELNERKKAVRRNLEEDLKEVDENVIESESFKKCLEIEVLKQELKIRDELQNEYKEKLKEIESKYTTLCNKNADLYNAQVEKTKAVDQQYREYLARILNDCSQKVMQIEKDYEDILKQCKLLKQENEELKKHLRNVDEQYRVIVSKVEQQAQRNIDSWKTWSRNFVERSLNMEQINRNCRHRILNKMEDTDKKVKSIEKEYNEKIKKYIKKNNLKS